MSIKQSKIKKLAIILMCIAVAVVVYYMLMIKPFDKVWDEGKSIYAGKLQPNDDHPLRGRYRLDWGEPYSLVADVKLDIRRTFVWRWGRHGSMMINYAQEYYDKYGNLLTKDNGYEEWILEKVDGKWTVVDINVPNL